MLNGLESSFLSAQSSSLDFIDCSMIDITIDELLKNFFFNSLPSSFSNSRLVVLFLLRFFFSDWVVFLINWMIFQVEKKVFCFLDKIDFFYIQMNMFCFCV